MSMLRKKIGEFYLAEQIGSGGVSEVYLGISPRTREKRAFKILGKRASAWSSAYGRFIREVDIIRELSHPGIIRVLDNGIVDDWYYYSMEFMPGGNLTRRMERGPIPIQDAMTLFTPVFDAMARAHERGVHHGALKPANILFSAAGQPVVSDFGIDKVLDLERAPAIHGKILGTIAYLAPEQRFNLQPVNRRADVYALGAILYDMLMGFPPLGNFPWPGEVHQGFPETLQSILLKCLAADPENRFEHAGSLRAELQGKWYETGTPNCPAAAANPDWFLLPNGEAIPPSKTDRIEGWFRVLRTGTARERLSVVREMVENMTPAEAKTMVKLYAEEGDRVRWGLIRVLGELRIEAATPLILTDLASPFHTECAIEALGRIGSGDAYGPLREFVSLHPECAVIALLPMANTGKQRAIEDLRRFLEHETAALRQAAVCALASIESVESLQALRERLCVEASEEIRSALFQAVHGLQRVLLPSLTPPAQPSAKAGRTPAV